MDYLKINDLLYEYFLRDEEGDIEGINRALHGVSLSVRRGDFISILGHNGSGKSTLAKLINALLIPAEGSVIVDGLDTKDPDNTLNIRMNNGMVFQNPDNQIVASVVEEDIAFGPENIGIEPEEIRKRVDESLLALNIAKYKKKSPNHLSGGQKQRVTIAGVLAMNAKCIIFDEATSMLDPVGRKDVIDVAKRLNRERGITIILITHNMEEVIYSDQVFVMEKGRIILSGKPREIFAKEEFLLEHGLDVPPMTKIATNLRKKGVRVPDGILSEKELVEAIGELLV